jgi:hypothetical protein
MEALYRVAADAGCSRVEWTTDTDNPSEELKKGILGLGISMIAGSSGQMRTKSARDHDRRPKCLNLKLRRNVT